MSATSARHLLGGHSPATFLSRYWQKDALVIRNAIAGFQGMFVLDALIGLACRDDVESRLVLRERGRWSLANGPFAKRDFRGLPRSNWTLLVQGANLVHPDADALLRRFAFIPWARLDDLMVSYAAPGGGVGPHFDSYDVFLLQGFGRRRWRFGRQKDLSLVAGRPLKILRRFAPRFDEVLAPGDMLYLPPHYAHDGVAVDACTTYSIGFRAASHEETAQAFVDFLRDELALPGRYADPDLRPTRAPARIDTAMRRHVAATLSRVRWDERTVARFLGTFLSEPKPTVRFDPPAAPLRPAAFAARIAKGGLALDRATQILYDDVWFYVNGEAIVVESAGVAALRILANRRALPARECTALTSPALALLHRWYRHGFLHLDA
jgi:50S ribosomal protein L16 3-hydroxylase